MEEGNKKRQAKQQRPPGTLPTPGKVKERPLRPHKPFKKMTGDEYNRYLNEGGAKGI